MIPALAYGVAGLLTLSPLAVLLCAKIADAGREARLHALQLRTIPVRATKRRRPVLRVIPGGRLYQQKDPT